MREWSVVSGRRNCGSAARPLDYSLLMVLEASSQTATFLLK